MPDMKWKALLATVAWLGTGLARADVAADIALARQLMHETRDEQAIQAISRSLDRRDATRSQFAELYLLLGIARMNLREEDGAKLAFRRALEADEKIELPRSTPPKTRKLFDLVRADFEADRPRAIPAAPEPASVGPPASPPPVAAEPAAPVSRSAPTEVAGQPPRRGLRIAGLWIGVTGISMAAVGGIALGIGFLERSQGGDQFIVTSNIAGGIGFLAVGAVVTGVGAVMYLAGGSGASATVAPTPGGVAAFGHF